MESGLPDDVLSDDPIMPEIPIKANKAIPITIGILLILGGVLAGVLALSSAAVFLVNDELRAESGFTEEQNRTFDMMEETGMAATFSTMYGSMALGLLAAGVMLIRKNPLGVKLGVAAGSIFFIANIVETIWMYMVAEDYGFEASIGSGLVIEFACGVFCIALPLIVIMIPEGRAALYHQPVILLEPRMISDEEE